MIAVILAAGISKRLRPLTNNLPKSLLKIGDSSLLMRYLDLLEKAGVHKTLIVHGFMHELVEKEVVSKSRIMDVEFFQSKNYDTTHPIDSFLLVEKAIHDEFLLLNADLYFSEAVLNAAIEFPQSCIVVDSKAAFIPNEMFVNFNEKMEVTDISKKLEKRITHQGKSVQIAKFTHYDKDDLFKRARELAGKHDIFYPAQAYDTLINKKRFFAVDVAGEFTHELDTPEDYYSLLSKI